MPLIHFACRQPKDDRAAWYRARFQPVEGVVFIGIAQEKATSFKARKLVADTVRVSFDFSRQAVAVNHFISGLTPTPGQFQDRHGFRRTSHED